MGALIRIVFFPADRAQTRSRRVKRSEGEKRVNDVRDRAIEREREKEADEKNIGRFIRLRGEERKKMDEAGRVTSVFGFARVCVGRF